jgi:hypothetical protein
MNKIGSINELLSKKECSTIVDFVSSLDIWGEGGSDFWDNRVVNYSDIYALNKSVAEIILRSNLDVKRYISNFFNIDKEIYPDTLQVIRWFPGMSQPPHADDMTNTDINGFEHRLYGSIIYLNDNYSGGETYYPEHNIYIKPEAGKMIVHPGTPEYIHGVTTIENDVRYTIASFWTFDKERCINHDLY